MRVHGYKLILKGILDNNPSSKIALFPCGTEMGCELRLMAEMLFDKNRFLYVDNGLCKYYGNGIISLNEALHSFPDAIYIITIPREHPTMMHEEDAFYSMLHGCGVSDNKITKISDKKEDIIGNFVCQLLREYKGKRIYDKDAFFQIEGRISKQIFDTLSEKYCDFSDTIFYTDEELKFKVYNQIYHKSELGMNPTFDLFWCYKAQQDDIDKIIYDNQNYVNTFLFCNQNTSFDVGGYTKHDICYMTEKAVVYERQDKFKER